MGGTRRDGARSDERLDGIERIETGEVVSDGLMSIASSREQVCRAAEAGRQGFCSPYPGEEKDGSCWTPLWATGDGIDEVTGL